ncbi:MAG: carboxypeptidase regulatory-like domain-containing protein [Acidobacteria bacterium]|nr:carboxypeptidase regulatory-like domain-containing protein [Acidobacteriota bacterium]
MFVLAAGTVAAQQATSATLSGRVIDGTGGAIPGATVMLTDAQENSKTIATDATGTYAFRGLAPGRYTARVFFAGFALYENTAVDVGAGRTTTLPVLLSIAPIKEEINIKHEPAFNRGTVVLPGADFEALSDNPDDLAADLEALAGSSAAAQGTQLFIDGFTGARLPPKASIREFRTNQNPFSAVYDRVGFGRIEVFTKPGSAKFRGQLYLNFGHGSLNSRNPFYAWDRPLFQEALSGGNLSGPLNKRASFTLDLEARETSTKTVINATVLDAGMNVLPFRQAVGSPQLRTSVSPRLDYQWNPNNTLVVRYSNTRITRSNAGIGDLSLLSRTYNTSETEHVVQLTETAVLGPRVINETRLQFVRNSLDQRGDNSVPTINVTGAFLAGGADIGHSFIAQDRWELQNYTYYLPSAHSLRWGARVRATAISDVSPQNFGGTFRFSGRTAPLLDANNQVVLDEAGQPVVVPITALEQYRRTVVFQSLGLPPAQIRALGGGASQFSLTAGSPHANVSQADLGLFFQDDWRVRQNVVLSLGLRYELQSNIHSVKDFAPRISFAWAPGPPNKKKTTALRFGSGIFYDRFSEKLMLQAVRLNGLNQQQYLVRNPDFFPTVPTVETLSAQQQPVTIRRLASDLRAPYIIQTSIGIERLLPWKTTVTSTFTTSRGLHQLRSRNINAPLPGTFVPGVSTSGIRPYGQGNIFLYESSGTLNQNQWTTNVSSRFHRSVALFVLYVLNRARSDTDGAATFPADPYGESAEYGRSLLDERHRFVLGASIAAPRGFQLSPYIVARSGTPFNITTGSDINGDTLLTERPALAADPNNAGVVITPLGAFNPNPSSDEEMIPRNYGEASSSFTVNLRLSKTVGFGSSKSGGPKGDPASAGATGVKAILTDPLTAKAYNLTFSVSIRNLLNHTNPAIPIGTLTSPLFGRAISLADTYLPAPGAGNRRVDVQVRLRL